MIIKFGASHTAQEDATFVPQDVIHLPEEYDNLLHVVENSMLLEIRFGTC